MDVTGVKPLQIDSSHFKAPTWREMAINIKKHVFKQQPYRETIWHFKNPSGLFWLRFEKLGDPSEEMAKTPTKVFFQHLWQPDRLKTPGFSFFSFLFLNKQVNRSWPMLQSTVLRKRLGLYLCPLPFFPTYLQPRLKKGLLTARKKRSLTSAPWQLARPST